MNTTKINYLLLDVNTGKFLLKEGNRYPFNPLTCVDYNPSKAKIWTKKNDAMEFARQRTIFLVDTAREQAGVPVHSDLTVHSRLHDGESLPVMFNLIEAHVIVEVTNVSTPISTDIVYEKVYTNGGTYVGKQAVILK